MGSIPASAGEPIYDTDWTDGTEVYPRECGGTSKAESADDPGLGLSPRVRGNL